MPTPRYFDETRTDLRFKSPDKVRSFRLTVLHDIHKEIIRRIALGERSVDIAEALGVSKDMVRYTKASKISQQQIDIIHGAMDADTIDLGIKIKKFAPIALQLLEDIVTGKEKDASIALRARVADRHLDRAGYSPVKKVATMNGTLSREDIEEIKNRSREAATAAGIVTSSEAIKNVTPED